MILNIVDEGSMMTVKERKELSKMSMLAIFAWEDPRVPSLSRNWLIRSKEIEIPGRKNARISRQCACGIAWVDCHPSDWTSVSHRERNALFPNVPIRCFATSEKFINFRRWRVISSFHYRHRHFDIPSKQRLFLGTMLRSSFEDKLVEHRRWGRTNFQKIDLRPMFLIKHLDR